MPARATLNNSLASLTLAIVVAACSQDAPSAPRAGASLARDDAASQASAAPSFDLNVHMKGTRRGAGFIKFRQPDDGVMTIFLETKIEGLEPDHDYYLQRAALALGSGCIDGGWLTLGFGTAATPIHTNEGGVGRADLFRTIPGSVAGKSFDIHFRVVDAVSGEVVLESACYAYTANPN